VGYSLSHLPDQTLLRNLSTLIAQDRVTTAELLAHLAEVDARKLYLPAGYPSMYLYCVHELRLCEQAAFKRIRAARAARRYPAILPALADGRLHLSTVVLLAPYLSPGTSDKLLCAAEHKTKPQIEQLLAERFPRSEVLSMVEALPSPRPSVERDPAEVARPTAQLSPGTVGPPIEQEHVQGSIEDRGPQLSPGTVALGGNPAPRSKVVPIATERFAIQVTIGKTAHDKLRHAQALLSYRISAGDLAGVLERVLDLAITQLEKQKFAATSKPRASQGRPINPRTIPARVRRAVWQRDGGQCTFVSSAGHRCSARERLEFDHVDPVARGGQATVGTIRLRCRAHNQYAAECAFGAEFMRRKRQQARERREARASEEVE